MSEQTLQAAAKKTSALEAILERKSRPVTFTVEDHNKLPGSRWRYQVRIDDAEAAEMLDEIVKEFAKGVRIPGFRPGKAPAHLVRNYFETSAREEVVKRITPRVAELISEQNKYDTIGQPMLLSYKSSKAEGTHIEIAFEVQPEVIVTAETFEGMTVESVEYVGDDAALTRTLDAVRARMADFIPAPGDYAYQKGDGLLIDCFAHQDGRQISELSDTDFYTTELEKFLPGEVIEALVGKTRGADVDVDVTHTHTAKHEGMAAATEHSHTTHFHVHIHEIKRRELPTLDDDFAKDYDPTVENLAQLKEKVREAIIKEGAARTKRETLALVFEELAKRVPFELPQALLQESFRKNVNSVESRLRAQKMTLNQVLPEQRQVLLNQMATNTQREVRNFFLSAAVSKAFDIKVEQAQIDAEIAKIAEASGRKPLAVLGQLERNKEYAGFVDGLRAKAVEDFILGKVKVNYRKTSELPAAEDDAEQ